MMHQLRSQWEAYLRVPLNPQSRQVKWQKLELFLVTSLAVAESEDGQIPDFSDMRSVCNLLAGEFLVDVHRICSESQDEDVVQLRDYLLAGRGGILLKVLHTLGVQGLSCSRELAELLLSLLPLTFKFPGRGESEKAPEVEICELETCFSHTLPCHRRGAHRTPEAGVTGGPGVTGASGGLSTSLPSATAARSVKFLELTSSQMVAEDARGERSRPLKETPVQRSQRKLRMLTRRHGNNRDAAGVASEGKVTDTSYTTSSDSEEEMLLSLGTRIRTPPPPLYLLNNPNKLGAYLGVLLDGTTFVADEHQDLMSKIATGSLELSFLLMTIIRDICYDDVLQPETRKSVSMYLLPSLCQLFTTLHREGEAGGGEDADCGEGDCPEPCVAQQDGLWLQRFLLRVILSVMGYVTALPAGLAHLYTNGVIFSLLHVPRNVATHFRGSAEAQMQAQSQAQTQAQTQAQLQAQAQTGVSESPGGGNTRLSAEPSPVSPAEGGSTPQLLLAHEVVRGCWLLVQHVFATIPLNPSMLGSALKLLHDALSHHGLELTEAVLLQWESRIQTSEDFSPAEQDARDHVAAMLNTHTKLVQRLKRAKVDYIHAMRCSKVNHKRCDLGVHLHHHHDIMAVSQALSGGDSYESVEALTPDHDRADAGTCAVAVLGDFLLHLYQRAKTRGLRLKVLGCATDAGFCCCISPAKILEVLLLNLKNETPGIRNYTLTVMKRVILEQCGGSGAIQKLRNVCEVCNDSEREEGEAGSRYPQQGDDNTTSGMNSKQETSDSAFSCSDASLHEEQKTGMTSRAFRWRALRLLQPLVLGGGRGGVAAQVMQHLLELVCEGSTALKYELFYRVFLPVLQATRVRYLRDAAGRATPTTESSDAEDAEETRGEGARGEGPGGGGPLCVKVVSYCLTALPVLLQTPSIHDTYLNLGGVKQLCGLSQVDALRPAILRVFEVLIVLEERKRQERLRARPPYPEAPVEQGRVSSPPPTAHRDPALCVLNAELEKAEEAIEAASYYGYGDAADRGPRVSPNTSSDTSGIAMETDHVAMSVLEEYLLMLFSERASRLVDGECAEVAPPSGESGEPGADDMDDLQLMVDLWNTCDRLFAQSSAFRYKFLSRDGASLALRVLRRALGGLVRCGEDATVSPTALLQRDPSTQFGALLLLLQSALCVCMASCRAKSIYREQELSVHSLVRQMKETLSTSALWEPDKGSTVKAICDTLLLCATSTTRQLDVVRSQAFTFMHLRGEELSFDKDLHELSEAQSSRDSESDTTERGYEGDSEVTGDCEAIRVHQTRGKKDTHCDQRSFDSLVGHQVAYPELCHLVVELLVVYRSKMAEGEMPPVVPHVVLKLLTMARHSVHVASALYSQGLVQTLLTGFRRSLVSSIPDLQVEQKLILDLLLAISQLELSAEELKTFLELFKAKSTNVDPLLGAMITLAGSHGTQPSHSVGFPMLRTDFYTQDLEISLRSLDSDMLTASIRHVTPTSDELRASESTSNGALAATGESVSGRTSATGSSRDESAGGNLDKSEATLTLDSLPVVSMATNSRSPLHCAPLQVTLEKRSMWPTNQKGFSMSLWLRLEGHEVSIGRDSTTLWEFSGGPTKSPRSSWDILDGGDRRGALPHRLKAALKKHRDNRHWSNRCLHLVSLGNTDIMFEIWTDPEVTSLIFRLVSGASGERVLCETALSIQLIPGQWQHLTVAFSETLLGAGRRARVNTVVDGCFQKEAYLEYSVTLDPGLTESDLCLGHLLTASDLDIVTGKWQLGNFMLFRDPQMTRHTSFHLFALGPDCCTLSQCDCSVQQAEYSPFITEASVSRSGLSQDVLTGNHTIYLQHLREGLVATYTPRTPTVFSLYGQDGGYPGSLGAALGGGPAGKAQAGVGVGAEGGGGGPASAIKNFLLPGSAAGAEKGVNPLMHQPTAMLARLLTDVAPQVHKGLNSAIDEIGGIEVFVMLFAKIVERESSGEQQAQGLRLLFTLMAHSPRHAQQFPSLWGYDMLARVLRSPRCHVGLPILKVLLDASLSHPILVFSRSSQTYQLDTTSRALIRNPHVVSQLLLAWRVWERAPSATWRLAFEALETVIRGDHPFQSFNIQQLQNANVISKLLMICMERLQDAYPALPIPVTSSMVRIIRQLIGQPPDLHSVMNICDFLLLAHPAAGTFVFHSASEFYFSNKWAHKETPKRKPSGESRLTSTPLRVKETRAQGDLGQKPEVVGPDEVAPTKRLGPASGWGVHHPLEVRSNSYPQFPSVPSEGFPTKVAGGSLKEGRDLAMDLNKENADPNGAKAGRKARFGRTKSLNEWMAPEGVRDAQAWSVNAIEVNESDWLSREGGRDARALSLTESDWLAGDIGGANESVLDALGVGPPRTFLGCDSMLVAEFTGGITRRDQELPASSGFSTTSADEGPAAAAILKTKLDTKIRNSRSDSPDGLEIPGVRSAQSASPVLEHFEPIAEVEGELSSVGSASDHDSWAAAPAEPETIKTLPASPESLRPNAPARKEPSISLPTKAHAPLQRQISEDSFVMIDSYEHPGQDDLDPPPGSSESSTSCSADYVPEGDGGLWEGSSHFDSDAIEVGEEGLVHLCANLMDLLSQVLVNMPDDDFHKVTGVVLKAESLIVMAHHCSVNVRTAVVKVLGVLLRRATREQQESFLRIQGFHLLAAQLHQHSLSKALAEACLSLVFGHPTNMEDDLDMEMVSDMPLVQQMAVVPLLGLVENSVVDTALCYNLLSVLGQMFNNVPSLVLLLLANGLVETLCNVIIALNAAAPRPTDMGGDERALLLENVQQFFCCIAEKTFALTDLTYSHHLEDTLALLYVLETKQAQIYGPEAEETLTVRAIQCLYLRATLDFISDKLETPPGGLQLGKAAITSAGFLGGKKSGLSQSDLVDRMKKVLVVATDFVLFTTAREVGAKSAAEERLEDMVDNHIEVVPIDVELARHLLDFIIKGIFIGIERSFFQRKSLATAVTWQAKDVLRLQLSRLVLFMMAPNQQLSSRLYVMELLANDPKSRELFKLTVGVNKMGPKMAQYIYELLTSHLPRLSRVHRDEAEELNSALYHSGVPPLRLGSKMTNEMKASMQEERHVWALEIRRERMVWLRRLETTRHRILKKQEPLSKKMCALAMEVTQTVNNTQNAERKKFLEHVKRDLSGRVHVKKSWQQLIQQLAHERAVWHCPEALPGSWQLDQTEGPGRIRKRLQRCHLGVDPKFVIPTKQNKLEAEAVDPPLAYLLEADYQGSDSAALIYKLQVSQNIQHTSMCSLVTPSSETAGALLIGQSDIYFVADEAILDMNYTQALLGNKDLLFVTLPLDEVKEVHKRWYQLRENALEVFLTNGKTCLLAFDTTKERDKLYSRVLSLELPSLIAGETLSGVQQLWLEGRMTNFDYLTQLNKLAGRSFNDLMQYPVFPFILCNYNQPSLDLLNPASYRDLSKPIAVQNKVREKKYIDTYTWLESEQQKHGGASMFDYRPQPYHYGSHYSNSGTVLHYLVRLPPFTQMFLSYQDRSFDLPDRTFHSMQTCWELASYESTTDVKELIPEFFFLPDFLRNSEGFHFGQRQSGERVWDVTLPPWSLQNARMFVLIHRQALESAHVTERLAAWVDLVFGYRQQGRAAVEAVNVFHPATYFGVDVDSVVDPMRRTAIKTMIRTYGQTPKQLFKNPHPLPHATLHPSDVARRAKNKKRLPVATVTGLRWGAYVGSPEVADPVQVWSQPHSSPVATLVALPTKAVFGLGPSSALLVMCSKEKGLTALSSVDLLGAAIVSWGYPDSVIRVKTRKDQAAVNFMHWHPEEQVTCCCSVPDCRLLFFGGTSGVVSFFSTKYNPHKLSHLQVFGQRQCLYGHSDAVTSLVVCKAYSVLVSASSDHTLIVWDLNRLSYVCSIRHHQSAVRAVAVSDTLGDIASVSHTDHGSCLMLHTVNGRHICRLECEELVLCLAYSNIAEGRAVNAVAGGLSNGVIRMWSSWDLQPIRDIRSDPSYHPIVSLTFTEDCQRLFATTADGTVLVWETPSSGRVKDVVFQAYL